MGGVGLWVWLCLEPAVDGAGLGGEVDAQADDLAAVGEEGGGVAFVVDLL
jgi:hypothetical protein